MPQVEIQAFPKVNLFLHVTGKRDDGYHLLDSLVVFPTGVADVIRVEEGEGFTLTGEFSGELQNGEDNLALRALRAFPGTKTAAIKLEKNIPLGTGLGGGSADAAATIRALEKLFGPLDAFARGRILLSLGADVPVCYVSAPCHFQGIGEIIRPVSALPSFYIVLAWPGVPSFTKDVFAAYQPVYKSPLSSLPAFKTQDDLLAFLITTQNDLATAAEKTCPPIMAARMAMESQKGCALARMTGSGSCVFGLFKTEEEASAAQHSIAAKNPGWWVRAGQF